jgi:hypothetical protein
MLRMSFRPFSLLPTPVRLVFACAALALACGPASAQMTLPLWPHGTPEPPQTNEPEHNTAKPRPGVAKLPIRLTDVTIPTLSVYPPHGRNTGAAALVFPGGGYAGLAMDAAPVFLPWGG